MTDLNTRDINALAGATYFVVGRGTEGGQSSYRLSVAGVTDANWGNVDKIAADSGYSLGTIQVDLGARGTWALGSTDGATPKPGETTYVDGVIDQAAKYAKDHGLKFAKDTAQLRADLLTHGNGKDGRTTLTFIDKDTHDSINTWASSEDGQKWIHKNIDYPQIKAATQSAVDILDKYGKNIPEDRRLETVAILAKTENQIPSQTKKFEKVLKEGGDYDAVLAKANEIKASHRYYDGLKAADIAEQYKNAFKNPEKAVALERAQAKVGDVNFDPSKAAGDSDIKEALEAIGRSGRAHVPVGNGSLRQGSHGDSVATLQTDLAKLGFTDAHGRALHPDGAFGPGTKAAVQSFQRDQGLNDDGVVGPATRKILEEKTHALADANKNSYEWQCPARLDDPAHPDNAFYLKTRDLVHQLDRQNGRTPDQRSDQLASALTVSGRASGLQRIDQIALSEDASALWGAQRPPGVRDHFFDQHCKVNTVQALNTPMEQSGAQWPQAMQQFQQHQEQAQQQQQVQKQDQAMQQQAAQGPQVTR